MSKTSILVIGSGGREHALVRSLVASPLVKRLYCAPGNAGILQQAEGADILVNSPEAVVQFIENKKIDLTVIGPEAPLVAGLSDHLRAKGHLVVGASQKAALLEGSKVYAKTFMKKYGIPTADFRVFDDPEEAKRFARSSEGQRFQVVKVDGLAAGKGVIVASTTEDILAAIDDIMKQKRFGEAGRKIVLEEKLEGPEVSLMALTDGNTLLPFPPCQDHKRVFDGDTGPNTGGMGAYAPTPFYDDPTRIKVNNEVIAHFLRGLKDEALDFRGIIYFGLMLTREGPKVLEFNVRLGDPEAQVVLPLMESDMSEVFQAVARGTLSTVNLKILPAAACAVVMASKGYPGSYPTGQTIYGLEGLERKGQLMVFHAGTQKSGSTIAVNGGRVLAVTGLGKTLDMAVVHAYQGVKKISFKEAHFRNDIAAQALRNKNIMERIKRMKRRHSKEIAAMPL